MWRCVNIARIGVTIHGTILLLGAFWWISARSLAIICNLPTDGESGWHLQSLARSSDTESLELQEMVLSEMVRWWLPTQHFEGLSYIQMAELGYITKGSCRATLSCTRAALPFICTKVINLLTFNSWNMLQIAVFGICPVFLRQPTTAERTIASIFRALPPPMWAVGLHLIPKSFTSSTSPTFHLGLPFLFPSSYVGMTRYDCKVMVILYLHFLQHHPVMPQNSSMFIPSSDILQVLHRVYIPIDSP